MKNLPSLAKQLLLAVLITPLAFVQAWFLRTWCFYDVPEELKSVLHQTADAVKNFIATQKAAHAELVTTQKAAHAELVTRQDDTRAIVMELAQKAARHTLDDVGGGDGFNNEALRAALEGSEDLKAIAAGKLRRTVIDLPPTFFKAITSLGIGVPDNYPGIAAPVTRRLSVRSLIPSVPTIGGSISYLEETGFQNLAATVSEGATKPESSLSFALRTAAVVTIAHWIRATSQVLADIAQLQQYIDGRLRWGLAYVEDVQLLLGSGIGNNLTGLKVAATAYNRDTAGDTRSDELRRAVTQLELTDYVASGIILNCADWEAIALAKESGTGAYINKPGAPGGMMPTQLWGLPVVSTPAISEGDWLVGDFPQAALIFDRQQARVDISTETDDDFVTNRCHIRAEERLALAVLRPGALIKGDFTAVPPTG